MKAGLLVLALALVTFSCVPQARAGSFIGELEHLRVLRLTFGDEFAAALTNLPPEFYQRARDRALALAKRVGEGEIELGRATTFLSLTIAFSARNIADLLDESVAECLAEDAPESINANIFDPVLATRSLASDAPAVCAKVKATCGGEKAVFSRYLADLCAGKVTPNPIAQERAALPPGASDLEQPASEEPTFESSSANVLDTSTVVDDAADTSAPAQSDPLLPQLEAPAASDDASEESASGVAGFEAVEAP